MYGSSISGLGFRVSGSGFRVELMTCGFYGVLAGDLCCGKIRSVQHLAIGQNVGLAVWGAHGLTDLLLKDYYVGIIGGIFP